MLNLNKTKRNIALILALVMALAMCLVGCTDQDARDAAEEAKKTAEAAVTTQQLTTAIENALKGIDTGVSADDVATSITAALVDYAKKSDIPEVTVTNDTVNTAITNALKDYQRSADAMTDADVTTIVNNIIKEVSENVNQLMGMKDNLVNSATALQTSVAALETAQAALEAQIKALEDGKLSLDDVKTEADKKIDTEKWNNATEGVVEKCIKVDELERKYANLRENYTSLNYQEIVDTCYGAKIRLYRAVDTESLEEIYNKAEAYIESVPDLRSHADDVEQLIQKIAEVFPVTTEDADVVNAASTAYTKLLADYKITDPAVLATKNASVSIDLLNYGLEKLKNVQDESTRLNEEVKNFLDKYKTFENIAVGDYDKIVKLQGEIEKFIADHTNDIAEDLVGKKVAELDKTALFGVDNYNICRNNNGVNTIANYGKFEELCSAVWYNKFEDLKNAAMVAVTSKWGALVEGMDQDSSEYKAIADVGTAFTKVMNEVLTWDLYTEKGANNVARLSAAELHLTKIRTYLKSEPENQDDDVTIKGGFNYYLDQVEEGAAITEPETLAETIIRELLAVTKVQASGEGFDNYKPIVINEFAKAVKMFTDGKTLTADQTNTVNDIFMSYAKYVLNMKYEDYTYSNIDAEYKVQVARHFEAIIEKFTAVINEVDGKTGDDVLEYGATQCKLETIDKIVKSLIPAVGTTTK